MHNNLKDKHFVSFFLLIWLRSFCITEAINQNFDDDALAVENLIDEKFKNEPFYHDLSYLNSNFSSYDAIQNKFAVRDRTGSSSNKSSCQQIRQIPSNIRSDLKLTYFYQKYTEAYGIPVVGSNKVSSNGLKRACYVLRFYLANNAELRENFYKRNIRVVVMAVSENLINLPEYNSLPLLFNTLRGLSPTPLFPLITVGEENVQCSINDKQKNEDLLFHQFSYSLISMNSLNSQQRYFLEMSYNKAKNSNQLKDLFLLVDPKEYLARSIDTYFGANKKDNSNMIDNAKGLDPLTVNLIQQIFICNNVYLNKCKTGRDTQVLKLGKDCDSENQGAVTHETTTKPSSNNDQYESQNSIDVNTRLKSASFQSTNLFKPSSSVVYTTTTTTTEKIIKANEPNDLSQNKMNDCHDVNENCELWTLKGECQRNRQFMSIECKLSCNFCKESAKTSLKLKTTTQIDLSVYENFCKDEFTHCPVFALRGDCKTNPHHMLDKCKRSCNLCGDLVEQKDRIQLTSKKSPIRRPISESQLSTKAYQFSSYSVNTPRSSSQTTITSTKKSSTSKACKDLASHCPELALRGDCSTNKDTMFHYCPFSCKFCS